MDILKIADVWGEDHITFSNKELRLFHRAGSCSVKKLTTEHGSRIHPYQVLAMKHTEYTKHAAGNG